MRARLIAALVVAAGLSGCADNNASVEPFGVCTYNKACSFGATCDALLLGDLWVDLAATNSLEMFVELHNQLPANGDETTGRLNSNDARLESVEVTFEGASAPAASVPVTGIIPASGTAVVQMYAVPPPPVGAAEVLSPAGTALKTDAEAAGATLRVIANVVAKGHYLGGGSFETGALRVPILVCSGCYGTEPYGYACENSTDVITYVCPKGGQSGEPVCKAATP